MVKDTFDGTDSLNCPGPENNFLKSSNDYDQIEFTLIPALTQPQKYHNVVQSQDLLRR